MLHTDWSTLIALACNSRACFAFSGVFRGIFALCALPTFARRLLPNLCLTEALLPRPHSTRHGHFLGGCIMMYAHSVPVISESESQLMWYTLLA
eukprot:315259-Pleurochrysis_carterae.AAC.1